MNEINVNSLISIGIPVYNGERDIERVIESFLAQTYKNFEIIISDNASIDNTEIICRKYSKNDSRVRYIRQIENQGLLVNFEFVLKEAIGDYFMWAASDDFRDVNFLFECVSILENNPFCVGATSYDSMIGSTYLRKFEVKGNFYERLMVFFNNCWYSQGLFYSLMPINIVRGFDFRYYKGLGSDWSFIVYLISHGEILRSSSTLTQFGTDGVSNSNKRYSAFRESLINWVFPFFNLSKYLILIISNLSFYEKLRIILEILKLNFFTAINQLKFEIGVLKNRIVHKL